MEKFATVTEGGGYMVEGEKNVKLYRLFLFKHGMEAEAKFPGMRLTRGPSCYTRVKREFGLTGGKLKVYKAFCAMIEEEPKAETLASLGGK
jgi:hypothetical protein